MIRSIPADAARAGSGGKTVWAGRQLALPVADIDSSGARLLKRDWRVEAAVLGL
jgi:hypothetical protein